MVKAIVLEEFLFEKLGLLVEIIHEDIVHELIYFLFFCLYHVIERLLHPHEHGVDIPILLLDLQILLSVKEEILFLELAP